MSALLRCAPIEDIVRQALAMILSVHANYPHTRTYVLKLHRDCAVQEGQLAGRLEHVASSDSFHFASVDELLACLTTIDAAAQEPRT